MDFQAEFETWTLKPQDSSAAVALQSMLHIKSGSAGFQGE